MNELENNKLKLIQKIQDDVNGFLEKTKVKSLNITINSISKDNYNDYFEFRDYSTSVKIDVFK